MTHLRTLLVMFSMSIVCLGAACKPRTEVPAPTVGTATAAAAAGVPEGFALIDASAFNVADYKGRVLLLDFWATWCGPCKLEIPHLIELQNEYRDAGLTVVGINYDDNADEAAPPYAAKVGMNYLNVRGTDALKAEYGVIGLPTIVIYGRDGNIEMNRAGYVEKKVLVDKIEPLLKPPSS